LLLLSDHLFWTAARSPSINSGDLVCRLRDANSTFPCPGSRYPNEIVGMGDRSANFDALLWYRN